MLARSIILKLILIEHFTIWRAQNLSKRSKTGNSLVGFLASLVLWKFQLLVGIYRELYIGRDWRLNGTKKKKKGKRRPEKIPNRAFHNFNAFFKWKNTTYNVVHKRHLTDFEALKMWSVLSGTVRTSQSDTNLLSTALNFLQIPICYSSLNYLSVHNLLRLEKWVRIFKCVLTALSPSELFSVV